MAIPARMVRYDRLAFEYGTTNKTDYRGYPIRPLERTIYRPRPVRQQRKKPDLKNLESMIQYKRGIPFSLLWRPKPIVRTNPWAIQKAYSKPVDADRERVQLSRPRLVMTPAFSLDGIPEPARSLLIHDVYRTAAGTAHPPPKTQRSIAAPLPSLPACANPVYLRTWRPPLVAPEWRGPSVSWDQRQLRGHCDPTREFWMRRPRARK